MNHEQNQKQKRLAIGLVVTGGILLLMAALAVLFQSPAPELAADEHYEDTLPYPEVPRITLEVAKSRYDSGEAIILDVRTRDDFEAAHIPNAISMPLSELQVRYQELPKDREILTYCT